MAMHNPKGRANYEPNSWGDDGGPRACPMKGFKSSPQELSGTKQRTRSETFADHYSQARQFYISQTDKEQEHIAKAFSFELSKVKTVRIRERIVAHLLNIDTNLARQVANMLGIDPLPEPAEAARPTLVDLPQSDKLSIMKNNPGSFHGRKIGILATDGADATLFNSIRDAANDEHTMVEVIAPQAGMLRLSSGDTVNIDQKVDGGPSVLYDAVVLLPGTDKLETLYQHPAAQSFVKDAYDHKKFIAYCEEASGLLKRSGVGKLDEGCIALKSEPDAATFLKQCQQLRYWSR